MTDREADVSFLLEKLGGCGRFQVLLVTLLFVAEMPASFSMILMSFGNYNPGWRCDVNGSLANDSSWEGSCDEFESCQSIQFNPEVSTVVTEWGLVCDRAWISSVIISVQMAGILVGAYVTGYLGDRMGRKRTFCLTVLMSCLFNLVSYFSTSWQMFAVMRFLIGLTYHCAITFPFVLASEFSTCKWRSIITSLPTWGFGSLLFALCATLTKDWRQVNLVTAVITGVFLLPALWVPESLRWLSLKGKKDEVISVTNVIARVNRKQRLEKSDLHIICATTQKMNETSSRKYSWLHLWRGPALKRSFIFTILWFSIPLVYYVLSFGIKSLTGNFYTNLMVFYALEIPVFLTSGYTPNLFGRKVATFCHIVFSTLCLFVILGLELVGPSEARDTGILVLVMLMKVAVSGAWYVLQTFMTELYPTVIRATSLGYAGVISRIGGIAAPYLIPNEPDTYYISYSIMAVLTFICSFLILLLPETKGMQLMDTWDASVTVSADQQAKTLSDGGVGSTSKHQDDSDDN